MPTNFNNAIPQTPTPDITVAPVAPLNIASSISSIGKSVASLVEGYGAARQDRRDAETRAGFIGDFNTIQEQEQEFYRRRDALQAAMTEGDEATIRDYQRQMQLLKDGRVTGVLTPMQATLQINNLLKQAQVAAPHLFKEFQAFANEAKGNVRAAAQELYGEDPITQVNNSDIKEATTRGLTVPEYRAYNNQKLKAELAKADHEKIVNSTNATADETYRSLYGVFATDAEATAGDVRQAMLDTIKKNPNMTIDELKAVLASIKSKKSLGVTTAIAESQNRGGFNFSSEQRKSYEDIYANLFANIEAELAGAPSIEVFTKRLQKQTEYLVAKGQERWAQSNRDNPLVTLAGSPTAMAAIVAADSVAQNAYGRMLSVEGATSNEVLANLRSKYAKDPVMLAAVDRLENGLTQEGWAGVGQVFEGQPVVTGNPVTDAAAKNTAVKIHENNPYDMRQKNIANITRSLDWEDLLASPVVRGDIKNNPEAAGIAVAKATNHVIPMLGQPGTMTEMVLDFSRPGNPVTYRAMLNPDQPLDAFTGPGPSPEGTQMPQYYLDQINETYRNVRDLLGIDAARSWLKGLERNGVKDVTDPSVISQPHGPRSRGGAALEPSKASTPATPAPDSQVPDSASVPDINKDPVGFAAAASDQLGLGLDRATIAAFMGQETGGKDVAGPMTAHGQAVGHLQIIPSTFAMINEKYFGNKLTITDKEHRVLAALVYIADIFGRRGNLRDTAMEYYSGTTNPNRRPPEGVPGPTAGGYADSVVSRYDAIRAGN